MVRRILIALLLIAVPARGQAFEPDDGFIPSGDVFEPLWADPVWPMFRFSYNRYVDDDLLGNVVTFGAGDTIPFWRLVDNAPLGLDAFELGAQGTVFSTFDQDQPSRDQFYTDFLGGIYAAGRRGRTSGLVRAYHRSSHVGDEFLLSDRAAEAGVTRENFGFERGELFLSHDLAGTFGVDGGPYVRVYGGFGYIWSEPNPPEWNRWRLQSGLELRSPDLVLDYLRPVAAVDVSQQEGNDFKADVSVRFGVQVEDYDVPGRALRLLFEYYNGKEVNGQFWEDDLQYFGFGLFINL